MDGMTVLDLTANVAGPLACQVFVDLGAQVIKVESADGEAARRIVALRDGAPLRPYFAPHNRGKLSVQLDLRTSAGRADILALADTADVVVDGFRPGVADRLGIGGDALRARNPRLVYASLSAYGESDPRAGIDMLVQAETGLTTGLRRRDGAPTMVASQIVDACAGHVLAQAVLAALLGRSRTGRGEHVRVALYDVACSMQANHLTARLNAAGASRSGPAGVAVAPSGVFRTADGFLVLAAYIPKHWALLCEALERPDLADDPRFTDQRTRAEHLAELTAELEAVFATATAEVWEQRLQVAGVMAARANSWADAVASEVFAGRDLTVTASDDGRELVTIRTPARFDSFAPPGEPHLPALGEHNEQLLGHP